MANAFDPKDLQIVQRLTTEIRELKEQFIELSKSINTAQSAFNQQSKSQQDVKNKAQQLTDVEKKLAQIQRRRNTTTKEIIKAQQELALETKKLREEANKELGVVKKSNGLFKNFTKSILAAGAAYVSLGAAIKILKNIGKVIIDFSKAQSNLAAILGKSKNEIKDLTADAIKYGTVTKFTATQVSELQTELAKLGFTNTEIKLSTKSVLDLAAATNAELGQAASVAGGALRAFNLDAAETERVASALAVATTKSALQFSDYGTIIGTVGPIANKFGLSLEDTIAVVGKLRDAQFDASSASTAFRNILLKLSDPSSELTKRFGGVATSSEELFRRMKVLKDEGVDLGEILELTDVRASGAFATMLDGVDTINDLKDSITGANEALKEMVDTQLDNLSGDVTKLSSAWEGFILNIEKGDGVVSKSLRKATQRMTDMLNIFNIAGQSTKKFADTSEENLAKFYDIMTTGTNNLSKNIQGAINSLDEFEGESIGNQQKILKERLETFINNEQTILKLTYEFGKRKQDAIDLEVKAREDAEKKKIEAQEQARARESRILAEQEQERQKALASLQKAEEANAALLDKIFTDLDAGIEEEIVNTEAAIDGLINDLPDSAEDISDELRDIQKEFNKAIAEESAELKENIAEIIGFASNLSNVFFDYRTTLRDSEIENIERQRDFEVAQAEEAGRSTAAIEEKYAKKENELRTQAAKAEKKQAQFNITLATAQAVISALASIPPNVALSIFAAITGAAELATVAATPIPKFGFGSKGILEKDTYATIGDRFQHEAIILPDGNIVFSQDKPQNVLLPAGSEVKSGEQTKEILKDGSIDNKFFKKMISAQNETTKAVKRLSISKNGNGYTTYENINTLQIKYKRRFS